MNNKQTLKQPKLWEDWELQYLQENYNKITAPEIAAHLNRTSNMVRAAAHRHGLCSSIRYINWTEAETETLIREFQPDKVVIKQLSQKLNRSTKAICAKAQFLGLTRHLGYIRRPWTSEEIELLKNMAGEHSIANIHRALDRLCRQKGWGGRTRNGIMNMLQKLQLPVSIAGNGDYYTVAELQECLNCSRNVIYNWITDKDFAKLLKPQKTGECKQHAGYLIHWRNLKKFFVTYPGEVERVRPNITWLITLLSSH